MLMHVRYLLLLSATVLILSGCFSLQPVSEKEDTQTQSAHNLHPIDDEAGLANETEPIANEELLRKCEVIQGKLIFWYWPLSVRDNLESQCALEPYPTLVGWALLPVYVPLVITGVMTSIVWGPIASVFIEG